MSEKLRILQMELLRKLYEIHSPSGLEKEMIFFLRDWIRASAPEADCRMDDIGNLYIHKGDCSTYPVIVAHLDQVQQGRSAGFRVVESGDVIYGFSESRVLMEGLGADDKNGIWVALQCLLRYPALKCCFFVQEEEGCIGSKACDIGFFTDARFIIQCDRRDANDLIINIGGMALCDRGFLDKIDYAAFGYRPGRGLMTDVGKLKERGVKAPCINLSCGYHRPHTDEEYTRKSELRNCLAFVEHILAR